MASTPIYPMALEEGNSEMGVCFQQVSCFGLVAFNRWQPTLFSYVLALPKFVASLFSSTGHPERVCILRDLEGIIHSGDMLLVLGRPGSGCSTFLKTLAGNTRGFQVDQESNISYQGCSDTASSHEFRGDCVYLDELDVHFPELTLGQTLEFAASARKSASPAGRGRATAVKFGLDASFHTRVGSALIRGISGGERRRTSIAEASLCGAKLQAWDNTTRGLDSATAHRLIRSSRQTAESQGTIIAMSLYQASEEIYANFDKVLLLYEGRQIYYGPGDSASEYFENLGLVRPKNATTPDFLTSLTNPRERVTAPGYESSAPRAAEEFANAWKRSEQRRKLGAEIENFNATRPIMHTAKPNQSRAHMLPRLPTASMKLSVFEQVMICLRRVVQRVRNSPGPSLSAVIANGILGLIIGSVFYDTSDTSDSLQQRATLLFFALTVNAFSPAFEVALMWAQRPIVDKHFRYSFYHPFTERLASILCDLPPKLALSFCYHIPLYFLSGLRMTTSAFFTYWLFMFVNMLAMSMFFRLAGSVSRTQEQTLVPVSIATVLCVIYAGFVVPPSYMVPWLAWFWRINPVAYTYESLMVNEFHGRIFPCSTTVPDGPSYSQIDPKIKACAAIGSIVGQEGVEGSIYLQSKYGYSQSHVWRNLVILLSMMIIFCVGHLLAAEFILIQRPRGEVLLFKRGSLHAKGLPRDLETGGLITSPESTLAVNTPGNLPVEHQEASTTVSHRPAIIHWESLSFDIQTREGIRCILKDVNGWVKPGTLTALMGVTGAGKTTLLDVLAQRTNTGILSGGVYVNGRPREPNFQRLLGYVQQDDIHLPSATVREALLFSAETRRSCAVSKAEKHYADAIIGLPGEGLNIEQRRTLSIAIELAAKPELLLFLDEPTSGLDSQTAWSICTLLRKLAASGQTILCTIHQPSAQLFAMFDHVLLLDKAGMPLYFGEIGHDGASIIGYFERNGAPKFHHGDNPADWLLRVTQTEEGHDISRSWADKWRSSEECHLVQNELMKLREDSTPTTEIPGSRPGEEFALPIWRQISLVFRRMLRDQWRDPVYLSCKIALCICQALVNGISFYKPPHDIQGLITLSFAIFLMAQLFNSVSRLITLRFVGGRDLFEARERDSKMYHWIAFICSSILLETFWYTLISVLVFVSWYYPTGLYITGTTEQGWLAFILIWLFMLWSGTICQVFAAGLSQSETAVQVATLCFWLSIVFGGILVSPEDLPRFWIFMYYVSPFTSFLQGLAVAGLTGIDVHCSSIELTQLQIPVEFARRTCNDYLGQYALDTGGYIANPLATGDCQYCPVSSSDTVLKSLGINSQHSWRNPGIMAAYVIFNIIATFIMYWLARAPHSIRGRNVRTVS
ncbi:ABC transporter-like protein [Xylariomycetidae sp. FL2044]|nr:ABC transporter-like protein [Xylariomycetidae sp. FL2044]